MEVSIPPELKKKAVKTHTLENMEKGQEEYPPYSCYFSLEHKITEEQAKLTEIMFGHYVCSACLCKMVEIVSYAGTRNTT